MCYLPCSCGVSNFQRSGIPSQQTMIRFMSDGELCIVMRAQRVGELIAGRRGEIRRFIRSFLRRLASKLQTGEIGEIVPMPISAHAARLATRLRLAAQKDSRVHQWLQSGQALDLA